MLDFKTIYVTIHPLGIKKIYSWIYHCTNKLFNFKWNCENV